MCERHSDGSGTGGVLSQREVVSFKRWLKFHWRRNSRLTGTKIRCLSLLNRHGNDGVTGIWALCRLFFVTVHVGMKYFGRAPPHGVKAKWPEKLLPDTNRHRHIFSTFIYRVLLLNAGPFTRSRQRQPQSTGSLSPPLASISYPLTTTRYLQSC